MIISHSSITAFKQCRRLHQFRYDMNLEPLKPDFDLLLGSAVHAALDNYYGHNGNLLLAFTLEFHKLFKAVEAEYTFSPEEEIAIADLLRLGYAMLEHYQSFYKEPEFLFMAHEFPFCVPIPGTDGFFEGRVDGIVCDEYGDLWVIEHKTAKSFPDPSYHAYDDQSTMYQWAMQSVINAGEVPGVEPGTPLRGYCYNGLRKAVPDTPDLLKNGKEVSVAKISTTYEVYLNALVEHGIDPTQERYQKILTTLLQQGNTFFQRSWWMRTQFELKMIERELRAVYKEMAREDREVYRTVSKFGCPRCPFREPCDSLQKGGNVAYLLKNSFRQRKERPEQIALSEIEA